MAPEGVLRLSQTLPGSLNVTFAGAEANVAASLAMMGHSVRFVTAMPANNPLTNACIVNLRGLGIDTSKICLLPKGRFGIYFVETGANQRPGRVTYDRHFSTISLASPDDFDWTSIFADAHRLHLTGITPALSQAAAETTLEAARQAKAAGLQISCDINFRAKLWRWNPDRTPTQLAAETMQKVVPMVDLLMASAEDMDLLGVNVRGLPQFESDPINHHKQLTQRVLDAFPNITMLSTTWRQSISASHNNWGAMLFDASSHTSVFAPMRDAQFRPYEIRSIVDRVGGGDAHVAGLLFALDNSQFESLQQKLEFATAASCLAHSVVGDFNFALQTEIEELMMGAENGRVIR